MLPYSVHHERRQIRLDLRSFFSALALLPIVHSPIVGLIHTPLHRHSPDFLCPTRVSFPLLIHISYQGVSKVKSISLLDTQGRYYQCQSYLLLINMPWGHRAYGTNDSRYFGRRHSTLDSIQPERPSEQMPRMEQEHFQSTPRLSAEPTWAPTPTTTDSTTGLSSMVLPPAAGTDPMQIPRPELPPRLQRFSMMRFRHASDSQLSKTAKDQAAATPPMPPSKLRLVFG